MRFLLLFILSFSSTFLPQLSSILSPLEVINKSIAYHDPYGKLLNNEVTLFLTETRPNGSDRKSEITFNIKKEKFQLTQYRDNHKIQSNYNCGKISFLLDGNKDISNEDKVKYKLVSDRVEMLKNYYQYLWLLPLKLNDQGTNLSPLVEKADFFGKESLQIKVTYDPNVGKDIWYFYFHPKTYALHGYRFYHDEEKNDGEYIILDNEVTFNDVRLPKSRKWYTHKKDKFLGADILDKLDF